MTLTPSRELAASMPQLQEWMKKHSPIPLSITAVPGTGEPGNTSEDNTKALLRLLSEKNVVSEIPLCILSCNLTNFDSMLWQLGKMRVASWRIAS